MAQELDDGEFWLPPQFLDDDDMFMADKRSAGNGGCGFYPSYGYGGFAPNSDLSSPVESVIGSSNETESDEEDYLTGLTRQMAHSTLQDDFWKPNTTFPYANTKSRVMAGSPQSTLCNVLGSCGCKQASSRSSPNCLSPPAAAALNENEAVWDLLYAAAGEVARVKMAEETAAGYYRNRGLFAAPSHKPTPMSVPHKNPLSYHQLQASQFHLQLKQQQMMKQYQQNQQLVQNRERNSGGSHGHSRAVGGLSPSVWPTLQQSQQQQQQQQSQPQQQPGAGMRAVFLGNPTVKRECTGTGVFLPRQVGAPTETRKKRGCSTVLLPDRVVQALNLNLEAMEAQSQLQNRCNAAVLPHQYDAELRYRNSVLMAQQRRNVVRQQPAVGMNNEVRLPQEWTY